MSESILDGLAIDVDTAATTAKAVQASAIQPIAQTFARNVDDLHGLLGLPRILLTIGALESHRLALFTQVMARTGHYRHWEESAEARAEVEAEVQRLEQEARNDPGSTFRPGEEAMAKLARLLEHPHLAGPARALLFAGVVSAWAAFECAAKDAWVAAVNERPIQLAQPTFGSVPEDIGAEGISGRHIAVGLLARHGFDLRGKLGSLLAPKFDFTGVSGIRAAYLATFGKSGDHVTALAGAMLGFLEATRHLIVHRAGIVDEEYRRRTADATPTGESLELNGARVSDLTNAAVSAGTLILRTVDQWLVSHPANTP